MKLMKHCFIRWMFFALKRIKTYSRNSTGQQRLSHVDLVSIECELLAEVKSKESLFDELNAIFVDFANVFDIVDHSTLICKLEAFEIQNPLLSGSLTTCRAVEALLLANDLMIFTTISNQENFVRLQSGLNNVNH
ncbi:hypothetical protein J6590_092213 [Homalodisca vitripennis]|nr:hypothetical protein J6590_092213 [Homalodisca vitripennis]